MADHNLRRVEDHLRRLERRVGATPAPAQASPHSHTQAEVTGLGSALAAKADVHPHDFLTQAQADGRYAPLGQQAPGAPSSVKLAADLAAYLLTTLTNTTGLGFNVVAGTYYRFTFHVLYVSAAAATGARFGLTYPAATLFAANVWVPTATADGTAAFQGGFLTASGDSVVAANTHSQTASAPALAVIEGSILPSANGTIQVQHAAEVAAAVTIKRGSNGLLFTL